MNTIETKSYFSSRLVKIVVLMALLACSLPSIGNDGRDPRHIKYVYGLYIFWHDTPTWDAASHYTVTYKDTTYNTYSGDIFIPYHNNNYLIDEIGDCAFKDCVGLTTIDMGFMNKVIRIDSCSFQNCTSLDSVTISHCLNYIGDRAFQNCTHLRTITLSDMFYSSGITHVGDGAFQNCYSLSSLSLPNLRYIGSRAFRSCRAFKSFAIPSTVTSVGEAAFKGCHSLDTVYIQGCDSIPIGKNAFADCGSLKVIICTALIPPVVDQDLGLTPEQKASVKVIVPKIALEAYRQAPYWKDMAGLRTRTYDFEVNNIYYSITTDDEVCITYKSTSYGSYTGTYSEQVVNMYDGGKIEYWRGMAIPDKVTFGGRTYCVTAIGENAFRNCTSINQIKWGGAIHNDIKTIGKNAFKGCVNLKSVDLPPALEIIGEHAFEDCSYLYHIKIPETVTQIQDYAFQGCSKMFLLLNYSENLTIGKGAFHNAHLHGHREISSIGISCPTITPPILVDSTAFDPHHYSNTKVSVLHSWENVFRADENWNRFAHYEPLIYDFVDNHINYRIDNDKEASIVAHQGWQMDNFDIPSQVDFLGNTYTVTNIEDRALVSLNGNRITIPNSVKRIGVYAFANSLINSITIGDSVEVIGYGAFTKSDVKAIHFPKSVKEIGDSALLNTARLFAITVEEGNPVYDSREGCNALIETATNRLITGSALCQIPSSVTSITDFAFYANQDLQEITIPESINKIGDFVFMGCSSLSKVTFSESLKSIGGCAFCFDWNLNSVVLPNSVDTICSNAFLWCDKLQKVMLGSGLKYIGHDAFTVFQSSAMDTVVCHAMTPPVMENHSCFNGSYNRATLLVPQASLELYKNDPNWSQFYKIVAIESSGIDEIPVDDGAPRERYNLQGQPVDDDYRGIVIENGKKILVE